ncbi:MAG TPA: ZIP family metal transporter [Candidatus Paceibacterota bacterium]
MALAYILSLIIASTSLLGLLFGKRVEGFVSRYSAPVIGVSVGILSVTVFHLGFEAFEESELVWYTLAALLFGFAFAELLHRFSHETHCHHGHEEHAHEENPGEAHACAEPVLHHHGLGESLAHDVHAHGSEGKSSANRVLAKVVAGDSVHNLVDGFTLAAVAAAYPFAAIPLAFSMFLHESIQEVAEFLVLKEAGVSRRKAVFYNVLSGLSIVLGVFLGFSLSFVQEIVPYLAGFSAGILLHFMLYDGLSILFRPTGKAAVFFKNCAYMLVGCGIGYLLLEAFSTHMHH